LGRTGKIYRKVRASFVDRPTNFGWVIPDNLAASGIPSSRKQVQWLKKNGVDSILTLTEKPLPEEYFTGTGVDSFHVQMFDHAAPSQESLAEAVHLVRKQIEGGHKVLVHCLAGQGRTGSVLTSYVVEYEGKDVDSALSELRAARPGSVERSQEPAVREYARKLKETTKAR
jgi:atypical dual specificity phosphatase